MLVEKILNFNKVCCTIIWETNVEGDIKCTFVNLDTPLTGAPFLGVSGHSVLGGIMNPEISRVSEISFFRSGWVVGITSFVQFCPILQPPIMIFQKN